MSQQPKEWEDGYYTITPFNTSKDLNKTDANVLTYNLKEDTISLSILDDKFCNINTFWYVEEQLTGGYEIRAASDDNDEKFVSYNKKQNKFCFNESGNDTVFNIKVCKELQDKSSYICEITSKSTQSTILNYKYFCLSKLPGDEAPKHGKIVQGGKFVDISFIQDLMAWAGNLRIGMF